ncbi:myoD family inhibitor isoform X1 [Entelurus aequoreus]|uniref:myoD family inhibitor-like n=1 Tax=Entelurus aequoreus TaxID=161455 RepID=UPI002B1E2A3F|nr:myoD family inhibitor-like [Entelurus aequoreus]XP_061914307.1 myoD family inhibitor isoform X1 [Entelurus aequoreus]
MDASTSSSQSECISSQPVPNRPRPLQCADKAPPLRSVTTEDEDLSVAPTPLCASTHPFPVSSTSTRHPHHHHLSSNTSPTSFKVDAAHIKEVAGDDCCVHCLLACLFCELLSMCSAVGACLPCAGGVACCCAAANDCCRCCCVEAPCTDEACQASWDCGMLGECCNSADCLEICLECCSICFPS